MDWTKDSRLVALQQAVIRDASHSLLTARIAELKMPLKLSREQLAKALPCGSWEMRKTRSALWMSIVPFSLFSPALKTALRSALDWLRSLQTAAELLQQLQREKELLAQVQPSHDAALANLVQYYVLEAKFVEVWHAQLR